MACVVWLFVGDDGLFHAWGGAFLPARWPSWWLEGLHSGGLSKTAHVLSAHLHPPARENLIHRPWRFRVTLSGFVRGVQVESIQKVFENELRGRAFLQVKQVASLLSISERTIRNCGNQIEVGDTVLSPTKIAGRLVYFVPDLLEAIALAFNKNRVEVDEVGVKKIGRPRSPAIKIDIVGVGK